MRFSPPDLGSNERVGAGMATGVAASRVNNFKISTLKANLD